MAGITIEEGRVSKRSRLYRHLTEPHRAKAMGLGLSPELMLRQLHGSHPVFLLKDRTEGRQYVLKSFAGHSPSASRLRHLLDKEYERLKYFERIRAGNAHARCVRPVCRDRAGLFFIEEDVCGRDLGHYAAESLRNGHKALSRKLDLLSGFLSDLHARTATEVATSVGSVKKELSKHAVQAFRCGSLQKPEQKEAKGLIDLWCCSKHIRRAKRSLVHGDVTVSNFLFRGGRMFAIDLERSRYADPVYDLGMMAGELFNEALHYTGNPYRADPYISHMYRSYAHYSGDRDAAYAGLVDRNPLYMANSLFRMARNMYFSAGHREKLAFYAMECLRSPVPK